MSLRVVTLVTILLVVPFVHVARAGWINDFNRWVGVGATDGYHSRTGCLPKGKWHSPRMAPSSYPATWAEPLPAEATPLPGRMETSPRETPPGTSLLRQPAGDPSARGSAVSRFR